MKRDSVPSWTPSPRNQPRRREATLLELYGDLAAAADRGERELVAAIDYGLKVMAHDQLRRAATPAERPASSLH